MDGSSFLTLDDPRYPALLAAIKKPPEQLFFRGSLEMLARPVVSVIGSRKMSPYGRRVIQLLVPPLVRAGLGIISGLAYGVDGQAHRTALENGGQCGVVLGSGLDVIYPAVHQPLLREILSRGGCAISEYESGTPPLRHHFPERNRIVAALSPVTLIIEAGEHSGTLITAREALEAGREVCVVPGEITWKGSAGVHRLLKQGARPVTGPEDILELYTGFPQCLPAAALHPALTGSPSTLYDLISHGCLTVDRLVAESGLSVSDVQGVLSVLELDGYIQRNGMEWLSTS